MTMTRQEQIRNKARELGQIYFPDSANIWARSNVEAAYVENACVEMAEWIDQHPNWISIEDELPPPHYEGANSTDFVLVYDGYDLEFGYYDFEQKNWHGEDYKEMMFDVTHWMPLPQLPRKEEE